MQIMHARTHILLSRKHGVAKREGYLVYEPHDTTQFAKVCLLELLENKWDLSK